jgi:hypothetical protein
MYGTREPIGRSIFLKKYVVDLSQKEKESSCAS